MLGMYVAGIGYGGSLISVLTVNVFPPAMKSIEELAKKVQTAASKPYSKIVFFTDRFFFIMKWFFFSRPLASAPAVRASFTIWKAARFPA